MEGKEPKSEVHIMFWACFAGRRQGPIISLEGDPESPRREVTGIGFMEQALKPTLPDFMEEGMIFMQDNAGPHRKAEVQVWLEEQPWETMEWPPYLPDLNPIEHCWKW
jgi:hypothetical protein